jgi:hypothetical protein
MMDHLQLLPYREGMFALCQTMWQHMLHRRYGDSEGELEFHIHHGRLGNGCLQFVVGLCLGSHQDSVKASKTL